MASKKGSIPDGAEVARALEKTLPGWGVSSRRSAADDMAAAASAAENAEPGPTLTDIRRKFLGAGDYADAAGVADAGPEDYGTLNKERVSVRVSPSDGGGQEKTADIEDGVAKIVQG